MNSQISFNELRNLFPQIRHLDKSNESYLDSASTTLKLQHVIDFLEKFYSTCVSNVHRGDHYLSLEVTKRYEESRESIAQFLNAKDSSEIVFTKGTTEGINFLAKVLGESLNEGDEILVSEMEHHSNFLPWQKLAKQKNLKLKVIPVTSDGVLDIVAFEKLLSSNTKVFSITHISNAIGTINPIKKLIKQAKEKGALVVVDAAQSVSFVSLDVQDLNCDFLVFSGHKIFAPSGIGVLYGKKEVLSQLSPYHTGGGMISDVSLDDAQWANSPQKFEAGTPFIEGVLVLAEVLSFIKNQIGFDRIMEFEKKKVSEAEEELSTISDLRILGSQKSRSNILSFVIEGFHCSDISFIMNKEKVAVRSGHHCCIPLMKKLDLSTGAVRASFSVYNREEDVQKLKQSVLKALSVLKG